MPIREAALEAMKQVTAPLVASALVLLAVFIPVSLMPGLTGQIYQQFGVVLSVAVVLSTVVALTLAPPLCVMLLREQTPEPFWVLRKFNAFLDWVTGGYTKAASLLSRQLLLTLVLFGGLLALIYVMAASLPTGFTPKEDNGSFFAEVQLPEATSVKRTAQVLDRMVADVKAQPGVADGISVAGFSLFDGATASNAGILIITLKDWSERTSPDLKQGAIFAAVTAKLSAYKEATALPFEPPAIPGLDMASGFEYMLQDRLGRSPQFLAEGLDQVLAKTEAAPEIGFAFSTFNAAVPQLFLDVDRLKVKNAGVPVSDVFTALQAQLGGFFVNNITLFGRNTPVTIQAESRYRDDPGDIDNVYVRNASGKMVPVSTLVTVENILGPQTLTRFNLYTQIGLVLLIGMAVRNAILIVEFAKNLHEEDGMPLLEAAETAGRLRLRPLLTTAFAFILGVFPLVIASGAGDGSRQALGQAVFGGMLSATVVGALLTPAFYVLIERIRARFKGKELIAKDDAKKAP